MNLETTELAFGGAKRVPRLTEGHNGLTLRFRRADFVPVPCQSTGMSPNPSPTAQGEPAP